MVIRAPLKENADLEERRKHRREVENDDAMTNLDGFDSLDKANRYEIAFPAGWKHDYPLPHNAGESPSNLTSLPDTPFIT